MFLFLSAEAQNGSVDSLKVDLEWERTLPGEYNYMTTDVIGNVYVITTSNRLFKMTANGDSAGIFNDVRRFGNPTGIDVSNPLKVIVYYRKFTTAVVLDRFLSPRNTVDFRKLQIFKVKTVANSYDNMIWLFDEQDFKLKKISEEGRLLQESADLRMVVDSVPAVSAIFDQDNLVYLYDPERGFYIFDYYGGWKNRLPFTGWTNTAVFGKTIYGFSGSSMMLYEMGSLQMKTYRLPPEASAYESVRVGNGKLYLLKEGKVHIYRIRQ